MKKSQFRSRFSRAKPSLLFYDQIARIKLVISTFFPSFLSVFWMLVRFRDTLPGGENWTRNRSVLCSNRCVGGFVTVNLLVCGKQRLVLCIFLSLFDFFYDLSLCNVFFVCLSERLVFVCACASSCFFVIIIFSILTSRAWSGGLWPFVSCYNGAPRWQGHERNLW